MYVFIKWHVEVAHFCVQVLSSQVSGQDAKSSLSEVNTLWKCIHKRHAYGVCVMLSSYPPGSMSELASYPGLARIIVKYQCDDLQYYGECPLSASQHENTSFFMATIMHANHSNQYKLWLKSRPSGGYPELNRKSFKLDTWIAETRVNNTGVWADIICSPC